MTAVQEEILEHYGIKGMKWGVRRDRRTLDRLAGRKTSSKSTGKKTSAEDRVRTSRRSAKSNRRTLSNQEIREQIDRLKLERELSKLTNEDLNPIRTKIMNILGQAGTNVGRQAVEAAIKVALSRALTTGNSSDAAQQIADLIAKQAKDKKKD